MDDVTGNQDTGENGSGESQEGTSNEELQAQLDSFFADSHSDGDDAEHGETRAQDGDAEGESEGDGEGEDGEGDGEPTIESALAKRAAARRGEDVTITAAEQRLLDSHDQAEENSRRDRLQNEARRAEAVKQLQAKFPEAKKKAVATLTQIATKAAEKGLKLDDDFVVSIAESMVGPIIDDLQKDAETVWREPELERQRQRILSAFGETATPELRAHLGGLKTQDDLSAYLYELGRATGRLEAVGDDEVRIKKSEYDELKRAVANATKANGKERKTVANPNTKRAASQEGTSQSVKDATWQELAQMEEAGELDLDAAIKELITA